MIDQETRTAKVVKFLFLGLWLVITVFPLYWIVVTSFKKPGAIFSYPLTYWPEVFSIENYLGLFSKAQFGTYVVNSLIVATIAAVVATFISMLSAYVLARFEFRSKGAILLAFLATQMIPSFIALGPLYLLMTQLKLVDNRFGLILIYIAVCIPFCTVMLRGFFENIPDALEEAAMIDGCSRFGALFRVLVPVLKPGIVAAFIFNFVNCWNELFLSVTLINSDANKTIPTALNGFITSYNIDWGSMSAAAVLTIIPTMVLFAFASRYIVQGLTAGAVKG
ncbi:carbohydrate ABC transporter permease [Plantibacter sp. PA-3-X8]|uniref:Multiple sugar transport system permease protein n=1 Tax=Plantibacter flavus TaxID=150123 RepID=A0A3N2C012_9MICO|nr:MULTISPECIES: carbohydrate ABC transporter permease [Plantibacter]AZH82828.1 carbohydrate ABC transporter permease [Plantibacter sp. PA-3-X8]MBF4563668.1 carbohydrate ABC transporter permease [Plantibacter sp. VKM Ac-2876]ROR80644.1 multiple sugar transport system permease protein [Plantibacter flavus]TKJ99180.1 carbohydrate ABC transporter permease [Plantibacter flavus]SMG32531.1 multiple sugar transport system permease protein [Plantibacter flavus]